MNSENRVTGRIIKIHKTGWGFISSREIEFTRIFFHWTALRQNTLKFPELKTGMVVEFTPLEIPDKGYRAMHIFVIDKKEANHDETVDLSSLHEQESDIIGTAE